MEPIKKTKICTKCKVEKELSEFYKCKKEKDGLKYSCKECDRAHYEKNKEKYNQKNREYYKKHSKRLNKISRQYYQENKEELKEKYKEYRKKHSDIITKRSVEWNKNNKERRKEISRRHYQKYREKYKQYRDKNKERDKELKRNWYEQNKERVAIKVKKWREKNPKKRKAIVKKYRKANPEIFRSAHYRREARKNGNGGCFTANEWEELKKKYNYTCPICMKKEPEIKLTVDHIVPVSKGGSSCIHNIQPLCGTCNSKKSTKIYKAILIKE